MRVERYVRIEKRLFRHKRDAGVRGRVPAGYVDREPLPSVAAHQLDIERKAEAADGPSVLRLLDGDVEAAVDKLERDRALGVAEPVDPVGDEARRLRPPGGDERALELGCAGGRERV